MKRTAEITLGIIGSILYIFSIIFGALRLFAENNKEYLYDLIMENQDEFELTPLEMDALNNMFDINLAQGGVFLIILPIIAIVLGIIATVLLKGNKNPTAAGIIFIATGVLYSIITAGGGLLSAVLFLIAGILCFARKPKSILEE